MDPPIHRIALRARPGQHFVYSGRSLLVTDVDGRLTGHDVEGFYYENTRLISREELRAGGQPLQPFAATPVGGHGFLAYAEVPGGPPGFEPNLYATIARFVGDGLRTFLRVENYSMRDAARCDLTLNVESDFCDIEESEKRRRQQIAGITTAWDETAQELLVRYHHPGLDRNVAIRVVRSPEPATFADGTLTLPLDLPPRGAAEFEFAVEPIFDGVRHAPPPPTFEEPPTLLGQIRRRLRDEIPRLTAPHATIVRAWETATRDLATLPLGSEHGPAAPIAGLPLYQQYFGRDTLTIAWQASLAMPTMLRDVLLANAAWQGDTIDDWYDEQPGKLIHQARRGPLSELRIDPFLHYYGDYATPPDFLIMLGQYLGWTNDLATVRQLLPTARKAITWLATKGDLDGDGFLEYVTRSPVGIKNQGWKDSGDAIVDERGEIVANPIATCELQAWWYAGLQQTALTFLAAGDPLTALDLLGQARALKHRFDRAFWMDDLGFYALALGPDKRQVRSITSNPGHLLAAGIVPKSKGHRVARRLLESDMFSGWGVRTLSSRHPRYDPFAYHLGSIWPVENAVFVFGFARYGCWAEAHRLAAAFLDASDLCAANRLPEVLGGMPRDAAHPHPGVYPHSNEPQGWSDSAVVLLVQALLGMRAVAPLKLLLVDPHLPPWLPHLRLEGVHVGDAVLDLSFKRRRDGSTRYRVERCAGDVHVLLQPVPQGPHASIGDRLWDALRSVWHS